MAAPTPSKLDYAQVLQGSYDEANGRLRVDAELTASIIAAPGLEVSISATDDNIAIRNSNNTNELLINPDGSINVTSVISGVPDVNLFEVGGTATAVNNGIANNGTLRVAIASDNTPFTVNAAQSTSPWVISGTVTANAGTNLNTSALALESTLSALNSKVVIVDTGNVTVVSSVLPTGASTSALQTAGNLTLSSILSTQTDKTQFTKLTDGTDTALITGAGELNVLSTAQPGIDIGDVTINNAAGAAAVNIQDGGNSITVDGSLGRTWVLDSSTDSVNIGNFPATVAVTQSTSPWVISGTVTSNQGTSPWVENITQFGSNPVVTGTGISGLGIPRVTISNDSNILATQSGTWNINNITGTVSLPTGAATEATLSAINGKISLDYGTSSAAIRTASQIGNATGSALFGAGTTTAQVLRVVLPTDQTSIPVKGDTGTLTDHSGTATGASVQIMASNSTRKYLFIQNNGNQSIWINFTTAATASQPSIELISGDRFIMENNFISTEAINIIRGGAVNQAFTAKEG